MAKARDKLRLLEEIREIRMLKRQAAEQDASLKAEANATAAAELENEQEAVAETLRAWDQATAGGRTFDPYMVGIWAAKLHRCERREADAKTQVIVSEAELAASRRNWQQAVTLFEQSDQSCLVAGRRVRAGAEESRMHDMADRAALRAVQ